MLLKHSQLPLGGVGGGVFTPLSEHVLQLLDTHSSLVSEGAEGEETLEERVERKSAVQELVRQRLVGGQGGIEDEEGKVSDGNGDSPEIGRASCRERVSSPV